MSNEYKPTYVDNTDNSISIMESTDTISFCKTGTKINTLSAKNVAHKKTGEDLNLCAFNNSSFNPVITINNNHGDCRIMTNLNVSGNLNIIGNGIINTSLGIGTTSLNNGFTSSNVHTNSILDINGQTTIRGHILPSQNAQFDLGNAEYKIRHLFLSDNSLWIGDQHKIDIGSDNKIKFKRRKNGMPKTLQDLPGVGDQASALTWIKANKRNSAVIDSSSANNVKLEEWLAYAQAHGGTSRTIDDIIKPGEALDWEEDKEIGGASFFQEGTSGQANEIETVSNDTFLNIKSGNLALGHNNYCKLLGGSDYFQVKLNGDKMAIWTGYNSAYGQIGNKANTVTLINRGALVTGLPPQGKNFPLQVYGADLSGFAKGYNNTANNMAWGGSSRRRYHSTNTDTWGQDGQSYVSIWSENDVYATAFISSSDERIKTNIVEVPDDIALKQIRDIGCKYYNYKNPLQSGKKMIGFIAQNVKNVYPEIVTQTVDYIPNILKNITNLSWTETIIKNDEGIEKTVFIMTTNDFSMNGNNYKFYVSDTLEEKEKELCIVKNNNNTFTFEKKWNYVYCYGYEVDDYLAIEYDKIFVLHHSAIQQIDKQQIADKQKIETLETKINTLETENAELKSIIDKLKTANSFEEFKNNL